MAGTAPRDIVIGYRRRVSERRRGGERERKGEGERELKAR